MSENPKINFGQLMIGQPLELEFTNVIDPVTQVAFTSLVGVDMEFTVKRKLSDADVAAKANIKEDDAAFSIDSAAAFTVRVVDNAASESLEPGEGYFVDGWLEDSNNVWRPFNFGTTAAPIYLGYFTTVQAVTGTKD